MNNSKIKESPESLGTTGRRDKSTRGNYKYIKLFD